MTAARTGLVSAGRVVSDSPGKISVARGVTSSILGSWTPSPRVLPLLLQRSRKGTRPNEMPDNAVLHIPAPRCCMAADWHGR